MSWRVITGDCRDVLASLPERSVHTCVTSPPYFGLRDYGTAEWDGGDPDCQHYQGHNGSGRADGVVDDRGQRNRDGTAALTSGVCSGCGAARVDRQIGLEPTPDEFVVALVAVFRDVRRVLRDDGTVWLNLGDSYNAYNGNRGPAAGLNAVADAQRNAPERGLTYSGCKPKDLIGIPWMVAFALRADGWYLRSEVIWHKPNPMPESVTDRPTKAHEQVFLLSKQARYFYDADAIREPHSDVSIARAGRGRSDDHKWTDGPGAQTLATDMTNALHGSGRNKRSVWTVATQPYSGAHFATFPPKLIEPCVLAGCPAGGTVLDPFNGAGTTGIVALRHNRSYIGIELNPEYAELARNRIRDDAPLLNTGIERLAA